MHIVVYTTLEGQKNVILASFGRSKIATAYKSHSTEKKIEQKRSQHLDKKTEKNYYARFGSCIIPLA